MMEQLIASLFFHPDGLHKSTYGNVPIVLRFANICRQRGRCYYIFYTEKFGLTEHYGGTSSKVCTLPIHTDLVYDKQVIISRYISVVKTSHFTDNVCGCWSKCSMGVCDTWLARFNVWIRTLSCTPFIELQNSWTCIICEWVGYIRQVGLTPTRGEELIFATRV